MPTNSSTPQRADEYSRQLLAHIEQTHTQLKALIDENDPTLAVTVTTAVPMDDALRARAIAKAEALYGTTIYLKEKVDPSIQGGIIFEATNRKRYDASVRAQLAAVRRSLASSYAGGEM